MASELRLASTALVNISPSMSPNEAFGAPVAASGADGSVPPVRERPSAWV